MANILYGAYTLLNCGLFLTCLPPFLIYTHLTGRYNKNLKERLGHLPRSLEKTLSGKPRIWIHAVSLGEVKVADPIIKSLKQIIPNCSIMLSTTTEHGRKLALEIFPENIPVVYAPIDFIGSIRKALLRVRPDILVFLETEIWPAWIVEAKRMGIKTALVNGRISIRSIESYLKLRPFFRQILRNVDVFSMISEEDGKRIRTMGADSDKIKINGNAKYDLLTNLADPVIKNEMRQVLNLESSHLVFVAGSTREGEEEIVLEAYEKILKQFPQMILLIAPRHVERASEIGSMLERRGFKYQLRSQLTSNGKQRTESIVIINTFGELFKIYSIGTIVFCGASLVPLGGQNPLEAAVWGKVVFYGPSMEDFLDAKGLLEGVGAGIPVSSSDTLAQKAIWFMEHPEELEVYNKRARKAVERNQNAANKHARVIAELF